MAYLQSRSGIARSGVTYCGWVKPNYTMRIAGSLIANDAILYENFKIVNNFDGHTSTMYFSLKGASATVGNDVKFTYSTPNVYEFAGTILQVRIARVQANVPLIYECVATGYIWMMDKGRTGFPTAPLVTTRYNCGVNTAVGDILARFTNGTFRVGYIPQSLGGIAMEFIMERVSEALNRIADAAGARWEVSADRVVSMYTTYPESTLPTIGNATKIFDVEYGQDLSQFRVDCFYQGGGSTVTAAANGGATTIAVADVTPFMSLKTVAVAGIVICGPNILRVSGWSSNREGPGTVTLTDPVIYPIGVGAAINLVAFHSSSVNPVTVLGGEPGGAVQFTSGPAHYDEATERALSDTNLFEAALTDFNFTTQNREFRAGRLVTVNITTPLTISGTFRIQSVEITAYGLLNREQGFLYRRVIASPFVQSLINVLTGLMN